MSNFTLPETPRNPAQQQGQFRRRVESEFAVALRVEQWNVADNSVTGVDLNTGELRTISLMSPKEAAELLVNREKFTNDADRQAEGERMVKNRNDMKVHFDKAFRQPGTVLQFQNVKTLNADVGDIKAGPDGRSVAKWVESLTTDATTEMAVNAQVKVEIVGAKNSDSERRRVTAFLIDQTEAATPDSVNRALKRLRTDSGDEQHLDARAGRPVLVTVADNGGENQKSSTAVVYPIFDSATKDYRQGTEALFEKPVDRYGVVPMAALAAKLDLPKEAVQIWVADNPRAISESEVAAFTAQRDATYEATKAGHVAVMVTPGIQATTLPHLKSDLMRAESDARISTMTNRQFFGATVSLRVQPETEGKDADGNAVKYPANWQFKQLLATEYLPKPDAANFRVRTIGSLGDMAVGVAEAKGEVKFEASAGYEAAQLDPAAAADAELDAKHDAELLDGYTPRGASMEM